MNNPIPNAIDDVIAVIATAIEEWKSENSEETLKASVKALLDTKSKEVTLKLLGFNNNWGNWELDHCNGRSGNSAAGDYLRTVQKEAIQEWFEQLTMPTLSEKDKKKFAKEIDAEFADEARSALRQKAAQQVNAAMDQLVHGLLEPVQVSNYLKMAQLINNTP